MTLEQSDQEAAAVQKTPNRVTLEHMESRITSKIVFTVDEVVEARDKGISAAKAMAPLKVLTICVLILDNGWTLVGKSAPADPGNFDKALGEKLAYEDCIQQLWPLEGYLLRNSLDAKAETPDPEQG